MNEYSDSDLINLMACQLANKRGQEAQEIENQRQAPATYRETKPSQGLPKLDKAYFRMPDKQKLLYRASVTSKKLTEFF